MWNYRILEHTVEGKPEVYFSLVEVFYNEEGEPWGYTGPISFGWMEMPDEILHSMTMAMRDAMHKPRLKEEDIVKNHPWDREIEKGKLREEILREEGLWEDHDEEAGDEKSSVDLGLSGAPISSEGVGAPEERDSGNGADREFP